MSEKKESAEPPQAPASAYGRGGRGGGGGMVAGAIALFAVAMAGGFIESEMVVEQAQGMFDLLFPIPNAKALATTVSTPPPPPPAQQAGGGSESNSDSESSDSEKEEAPTSTEAATGAPIVAGFEVPHVFTEAELLPYNGQEEDKPIFLVVCGQVFDVSAGKEYYGKGEGYSVFAGKDASRAFVTGEFSVNETETEEERAARPKPHDVTPMKPEELLGIDDWRQFYHKEDKYHFIGYVTMDAVEEGYYDAEGNPTRKLDTLEALFKEAYAKKDYKEEQQKKYPGCNSSYKAGKGGRVWCADNKLVPRKGQMEWDTSKRCACYTPMFAAEHTETLAVYDKCDPAAYECKIK